MDAVTRGKKKEPGRSFGAPGCMAAMAGKRTVSGAGEGAVGLEQAQTSP
jgi:hypothetical protein